MSGHGMRFKHCIGLLLAVALGAGTALAQDPPPPPPSEPGATPYIVFVRGRPVGREDVLLTQDADGWFLRGTSRLGAPIDLTTRRAEIRYDASWHPRSLLTDSIVRGQDVNVKTTFADGKAQNEVSVQGVMTPKDDTVSADTVVLPNAFLGSYAALARRLQGAAANTELRAYIAPQVEVTVRLTAVAPERIETAKTAIAATRYSLQLMNPAPNTPLDMVLWADDRGGLLRLAIPMQALEMAREDISSAATRTASFTLPGDENVLIPAVGFNLAGTITTPASASGPLPAVVLIGGSGPTDRDETVYGIPVFGQLAGALAEAGFLVVRYDKRGVGQSGGRVESATLADYAEDARAVVKWLEKRKDVDKKRIAVAGHSEGALVAMLLSAREDKLVKATVLIAAPSITGGALVLEQQKHLLELMKADDADKSAKIALQERINAAVTSGVAADWGDVPEPLRKAADTPWFQSFLAFDPAKAMKDVKQPILIVQGALDTQVPAYHADRLAEMADARKKKADVQVMKVPGLNHLLVPATTGEVNEYASLGSAGAKVGPAVGAGIGVWLAKTLGPGGK